MWIWSTYIYRPLYVRTYIKIALTVGAKENKTSFSASDMTIT